MRLFVLSGRFGRGAPLGLLLRKKYGGFVVPSIYDARIFMAFFQIFLFVLMVFISSPIWAQTKNQPYKFITQDGLEEIEEVEPERSPEPPPVEKPKVKPEPSPKKQATNELLKLPPKGTGKNNLDFLEGCWTAVTGLVEMKTRRPLNMDYCFNQNGQGTWTVLDSNGQRCQGTVRATYNGQVLTMKGDTAPCGSGGKGKSSGSYSGQTILCHEGGNEAVCQGRNNDGGVRWGARFRRK